MAEVFLGSTYLLLLGLFISLIIYLCASVEVEEKITKSHMFLIIINCILAVILIAILIWLVI